MNIKEILLDGLKQQIAKRKEDNAKSPGRLRAGNSGIIVSASGGDRVKGNCHRKALLRKFDIDLPAQPDVHKIFESGLGSEEAIAERLKSSKILKDQGIEVRCEEEIPTSWNLSDGTPVTGRPDAVLIKDGEPIAVFEMKQKQTANGFQNVVDSNKPDSAHLCQVAHYSWQLGLQTKEGKPIPGYIVYSWPLLHDNLMRRDFYKTKKADEFIELPRWKSKNPGMAKMKIKPGDEVYHITWNDDGEVEYRIEGEEKTTTTDITIKAMQDFYEATNAMEKEQSLGPRPSSVHVGKKVSAGYPPCGYCELAPICDKYENSYQEWLDRVKLYSEESDWTETSKP